MEQFKELHKTVEQLRTSGLSTGEIKKVSRMFFPTSVEGTAEERENLVNCVFCAPSDSLPFPFHWVMMGFGTPGRAG